LTREPLEMHYSFGRWSNESSNKGYVRALLAPDSCFALWRILPGWCLCFRALSSSPASPPTPDLRHFSACLLAGQQLRGDMI
jgi:hypothetical protein